MQFACGGVGLFVDELPQACQVDLHDGNPAARPRGGLPMLAATLHDAADPGRTDPKEAGDLDGRQALVARGDDTVTQVL